MNIRLKRNSYLLIGAIALGLTGIAVGLVAGLPLYNHITQEAQKAAALDSTPAAVKAPIGGGPGSFRKVVASVSPSIVELRVIEVVKARPRSFSFPFLFGAPPASPQTKPKEYKNEGLGSGIIFKKVGATYYVMTNNHVVKGAQSVKVVLSDEEIVNGKIVGTDPRKDFAIVSFQYTHHPLTIATIGDSDKLAVGDWVIAIGSPFGLQSTVSAGIVSALGRWNGPDGSVNNYIQTDAAINQGNSGGALFNTSGQVVGINTWISTPNGLNIGLGFSIPINNIQRSIRGILKNGKVDYGWLGIVISPLGPDMAKDLAGDSDFHGVFVHEIFEGSPAMKYGLRPGDVIISLNSKPVKNYAALTYKIGDLTAGEKANFTVLRSGKKVNLSVTIAKRVTQKTMAAGSMQAWPGASVLPLTEDLRKQLTLNKSIAGLVVISVLPKTMMQSVGLKPGDIITKVNGTPVKTMKSFYSILNDQTNTKFRFEYVRDDHVFDSASISRSRRGY